MAWYDDMIDTLGARLWRPTAGDTQKTIATDISGGVVGALVIAEAAFDLRVEATIAPTGNDQIWPIGIFVDMQAALSGPSTITLTGTIDTDLSPLNDLEEGGGLALEVNLGGNALTLVNEGTLHSRVGISVTGEAGAVFTLVNAGLIETYYSPLSTDGGKTILHNTATGVIGTFTSLVFPGEVLELWNEGEIQSTLSVAAATLVNTGMMAGVRCFAAPRLVRHDPRQPWHDHRLDRWRLDGRPDHQLGRGRRAEPERGR